MHPLYLDQIFTTAAASFANAVWKAAQASPTLLPSANPWDEPALLAAVAAWLCLCKLASPAVCPIKRASSDSLRIGQSGSRGKH